MLQTISGTSGTDLLYRQNQNPYMGHFQVTKNRDFSHFLKIIHKLTSFFTLCSVVWRKKRIKQSQEPRKRISTWKTLISIYWPFSGNKTRDFSNFLKIIHKLTSFFTSCSVVWHKKHFKQSQEPQQRIVYIGNIEIHILAIFR